MKVTTTYDDTLYQLVPKRLPFETEMRPVIARMCRNVEGGACILFDDFWNELLSAAPTPPAQPAEEPVPFSGADETPPVFGRRWSPHPDGFGLKRDDLEGVYVHIDDALSTLHQWQQEKERQGINFCNAVSNALAVAQPAERMPLTEEQIKALQATHRFSLDPYSFARAVEAAHGITAPKEPTRSESLIHAVNHVVEPREGESSMQGIRCPNANDEQCRYPDCKCHEV